MDTDEYGNAWGTQKYYAKRIVELEFEAYQADKFDSADWELLGTSGITHTDPLVAIREKGHTNPDAPKDALVIIAPGVYPGAAKAFAQAIAAIPDMIRALENIAALADHLDLPADEHHAEVKDVDEVSSYVLDLVMPALEKAVGR